MEYRQLGNSGLKVSALTLGTMTFGGQGGFAKVGAIALAEARRLIDLVADAGVNLIDTADVYSGGLAEEIIGEAMGGKRKPGMLIATKARFTMGPGPNDKGLSRWHLIRACEASLKRLRTDVIDLYQVHEWDGLTPLEETMEALDSLVRAGKVRYVGCSNFSGWHVMKAMEIARREGRIPFVSQQIHYTLQAREAEYELIPISIDQKLGVLVWSPLAGGLLAASIGATRRRRRHAADRRLEGAADRRREQAVEHRRRTRRRRRCAQGLGGADRARLAARTPRHYHDRHRRAHRGANPRQPRLRRRQVDGAGASAARQGQPADAHLPLLAPGVDGERPARRRRSLADRTLSELRRAILPRKAGEGDRASARWRGQAPLR